MNDDMTVTEKDRYLPYPLALRRLDEQLDATPEELAAWIFLEPEAGGIAAYLDANELDTPRKFHFSDWRRDDYRKMMMHCWFLEREIQAFTPAARYITGVTLVERWSRQLGIQPQGFIEAKIAESRLLDLHPVWVLTRGSYPEDAERPPLEEGLFSVAEIQAIEVEDFGGLVDLLTLQDDAFNVDPRTSNYPVNHASVVESPAQRRERLSKRKRYLKNNNVRSFSKTTAQEEGISVSRLKQLLKDETSPAKPRKD